MSKPEALKHLETAEDKLVSAQALLDANQYEDSLGRAYYAMFHSAQAVLAANDLEARTHRGLLHTIRERFADRFPPDLLTALGRQQRLRESADYDVAFRATKEDAQDGIQAAKLVIERARKLVES